MPNRLIVHLDLYSYCNAKCYFCGYHGMTRKRGAMSPEIFTKVIDEISTLGMPVQIIPYFYGETLMNPHLIEQCEYISDKLPYSPIAISTNGSYLSDSIVYELAGIKTLKFVNFSVYAGTKERYEWLMGLPFETLDKVESAIGILREKRPDIGLCIGATSDLRFVTQDDIDTLKVRFGDIVSQHTLSFHSQHKLPEYARSAPDSAPCMVSSDGFVVYWDGRVGLCGFDINADLVIGDVTKTSLLDAINSDIAGKYRCAHTNGLKDVIQLCRTCTHPH